MKNNEYQKLIWALLPITSLAFSSFNHFHILFNKHINLQISKQYNIDTIAYSSIMCGIGKILALFTNKNKIYLYLLAHSVIVWTCGLTHNHIIFIIARLMQGLLAGIILGILFGDMSEYAKYNKSIYLIYTGWDSFIKCLGTLLGIMLPFIYMNIYVCAISTLCFIISFIMYYSQYTSISTNVNIITINVKKFITTNIIYKILLLVCMSWIMALSITTVLKFETIPTVNQNLSDNIIRLFKGITYMINAYLGFILKHTNNHLFISTILIIINIILLFINHYIAKIFNMFIAMTFFELICSVINNRIAELSLFSRTDSILFLSCRSLISGLLYFYFMKYNSFQFDIFAHLISLSLIILYYSYRCVIYKYD